MTISQDDMKKLESLSRLDLDEEEREEFIGLLGAMAERTAILSSVDTDAVEAMVGPNENKNVFRNDNVGSGAPPELLLESAPRHKDGFFEVPKTLD